MEQPSIIPPRLCKKYCFLEISMIISRLKLVVAETKVNQGSRAELLALFPKF
jgi:hypothetical protein